MIVCSCKFVSDHQIRDSVNNGCKSWKQLTKSCGVSTECGTCALTAKSIFDQARVEKASTRQAKMTATSKRVRRSKTKTETATS